MKTVITFIIALVVGVALALVVRSALHDPHAGHAAQAGSQSNPAPAAMVDPHAGHAPDPVPTAPDPHAGHAVTPETGTTAPADLQTVNSICPICGMDVDPSLGIWHYQGKPIGIGCRACVDKIENEMERYGPAALENKRLR